MHRLYKLLLAWDIYCRSDAVELVAWVEIDAQLKTTYKLSNIVTLEGH